MMYAVITAILFKLIGGELTAIIRPEAPSADNFQAAVLPVQGLFGLCSFTEPLECRESMALASQRDGPSHVGELVHNDQYVPFACT